MLNLRLPFQLVVSPPETFLRSSLPEFRKKEPVEIILEGLSISITAGTAVYEVTSHRALESGGGPSRGTAWTRWLWSIEDEIAIEQQMAIPANGDALAISWRSVGRPLVPCRFEVTPIFSAASPFTDEGFRFEPESNGGRLAWQPLENSTKIIADTNGRFDPIGLIPGPAVVPAAFEFNLSPQPAILILSSEVPRQAEADPLIGGFLARLTTNPATAIEPERLRNLAAA